MQKAYACRNADIDLMPSNWRNLTLRAISQPRTVKPCHGYVQLAPKSQTDVQCGDGRSLGKEAKTKVGNHRNGYSGETVLTPDGNKYRSRLIGTDG
jgi:hypothetical protein